MDIVIYTLNGCSVCKALKSMLDADKIDYTEKCCDYYENECDYVESESDCNNYPIIHIKDANVIVCIADDVDSLKKQINTQNKNTIVYKYDISSMLNYIHSIKN